MIELRWLESNVHGGDGSVYTETVLQYRQQFMVPVGGWTQGEEPQKRPEWGPWQDVPTVMEG